MSIEITEEQLTWFPVYVDRILASPRWQNMSDFQRGWYWQLILLSTRSDRIGYLKLDEQLWKLAGAHRREMWDNHKSAVMACFKFQEFDGQTWIYNERLLKTISEQNAKRNKGVRRKEDQSEIDLSVSISEVAVAFEVGSKESTINEIYKAYPRKLGPRPAKRAIGKALTRLLAGKEAPAEIFNTVDDAAIYLLQRVRLFAMTPAGQAGEFTPYPATWFNDSRYLDEESEWSKRGQTQQLTKTEERVVSNAWAAAASLGMGYSGHKNGDAVRPTETPSGDERRLQTLAHRARRTFTLDD